MRALFSPSALWLFGVNLGVIVFAVRDEWSLPTILASCLLQSFIMGIFQAKKILDLKVFSTEGLKMGGHSVEPIRATQWWVVVFFLGHCAMRMGDAIFAQKPVFLVVGKTVTFIDELRRPISSRKDGWALSN
jgi:hypothetical protein